MCIVLCIVLRIVSPFVYNCLFPIFVQLYRPLPPDGNPNAVNKYIISYNTRWKKEWQPHSVCRGNILMSINLAFNKLTLMCLRTKRWIKLPRRGCKHSILADSGSNLGHYVDYADFSFYIFPQLARKT